MCRAGPSRAAAAPRCTTAAAATVASRRARRPAAQCSAGKPASGPARVSRSVPAAALPFEVALSVPTVVPSHVEVVRQCPLPCFSLSKSIEQNLSRHRSKRRAFGPPCCPPASRRQAERTCSVAGSSHREAGAGRHARVCRVCWLRRDDDAQLIRSPGRRGQQPAPRPAALVAGFDEPRAVGVQPDRHTRQKVPAPPTTRSSPHNALWACGNLTSTSICTRDALVLSILG